PDGSSSSSKALASSADELTEQQQAALTGWYAGNYAKTDGQPSANSKVGVTKASRSQMGTPALPTGGDTYYQMYWQDGYGDKSLTYTVKDGQVRSEERRVGKECRAERRRQQKKKKE